MGAPYGYLQTLIRTGHPDKPDECWRWPGTKTRDGYGRVCMNGRLQLAHRVAYELHVGPIPDGLVIDHVCYTYDCFNPAHLEPVTRVENQQNRGGLAVNNTSGHRGVTWLKHKSRWQVQVWHGGTQHYGGCHLSQYELF